MAHPVHAFPEPDHDHARCAADAIAHAELVCRDRGQRFTPIRRQVLQALLSSHRPLGAYDVIELLARGHARPAPITIYRALDFLIEQGLVHRIVSRNAFLACGNNHRTGALIMSYILARDGHPPFVLTVDNAKAYFDPSTLITKRKKKSLTLLFEMPRLKRNFAAFLHSQANARYLQAKAQRA